MKFHLSMFTGIASITYVAGQSCTISTPTCSNPITGSYAPESCFPNTGVCYPTNYYTAQDQGQFSSANGNFASQLSAKCPATCSSNTQCASYIGTYNAAADSKLATGTCFYYSVSQVYPRQCADTPTGIIASYKQKICPTTTTTTTSSTTTKSIISTTTIPSTSPSTTTSSMPIPTTTTSSTTSSTTTATTTSSDIAQATNYPCSGYAVRQPCGPNLDSTSCRCLMDAEDDGTCVNFFYLACNSVCTTDTQCGDGYVCGSYVLCGQPAGQGICEPTNDPDCGTISPARRFLFGRMPRPEKRDNLKLTIAQLQEIAAEKWRE